MANNSSGHLSDRELEWIADDLDSTELPVKIVVLHYPPFDPDDSAHIMYSGNEAFMDLMEAYGMWRSGDLQAAAEAFEAAQPRGDHYQTLRRWWMGMLYLELEWPERALECLDSGWSGTHPWALSLLHTGQAHEMPGGEDVGDQAVPAMRVKLAVPGHDAGGILPAMLHDLQRVVQVSDDLIGPEDPDDSAHAGLAPSDCGGSVSQP